MFDLNRFLSAQKYHYGIALEEVRNGHKEGHWMWYIFPQLRGLGQSPTAQYYALQSMEEAKAYLAHPVLGERLERISKALLSLDTVDPHAVFGTVDTMKLKSSMTLFEVAAPESEVFGQVLDRFFHGHRDTMTLSILRDIDAGRF